MILITRVVHGAPLCGLVSSVEAAFHRSLASLFPSTTEGGWMECLSLAGSARYSAAHESQTPTRVRKVQRKPMWLIPVSIIWGRLAAGRYRIQ